MVTITDISALRVWAHGEVSRLLDVPCASSGLAWSVGSARELREYGLESLGLGMTEDDPLHVLVDDPARRIRSRGVRCHVWSGALPPGSLYQLAPGVLVASPAFCCLQIASRSSLPRVASVEMECLGRYGRVPSVRGFLDREPLVTRPELEDFLGRAVPAHGARRALRALGRALEPARSPLETKASLILTLPARLGGYSLPQPELNRRIRPLSGEVPYSQFALYEVDLCWPRRRTIVEVDSYQVHMSKDAFDDDAKKRNSLKSMGWKVTSVTSGQLSGDALDVLARQLARDLRVPFTGPAPERRDWLIRELA